MKRMRPLIISGVVIVLVFAGLAIYNAVEREAAGRPECPGALFLFYGGDDEMEWATTRLGRDPRVSRVFAETKRQVYARVRQSHPHIAAELTVETTPAVVTIALSPGFDRDEVLDDFKKDNWFEHVQDCGDPRIQSV